MDTEHHYDDAWTLSLPEWEMIKELLDRVKAIEKTLNSTTENLRPLSRIHEFDLGVDDNGKDYCYFGPFDSQKDAIGFALLAIAAQPLDKEATDGQGDTVSGD